MATKHNVMDSEKSKYFKADKAEKKEILDRLSKTIKMHRKSIIRRFRVIQTRKEGYNWSDKRGRKTYYTPDCIAALREVWDISHELCAERLLPEIPEYVRILKRDKMWSHSDEATGKLLSMSLGTMKSHTQSFDKVSTARKGLSSTKPTNLKELIPIRRGPWKDPEPGRGEIDTVAHCGNTLEGLFAYTTQYTDVSTIWCFLEAQMGKGKIETVGSINNMNERTPFPLLGLDPDSGSEFINWNLKGWCDERGIEMTRIRPGVSNDHGRIEQKNDKNIRKWVGYIRIETEERLAILKELYKTLEIYINHFQPSMKCIEKVKKNKAQSSRKYDTAKTPYQRVMEHPSIKQSDKDRLKEFHETLNPKKLHDILSALQKKLYAGAKFTK